MALPRAVSAFCRAGEWSLARFGADLGAAPAQGFLGFPIARLPAALVVAVLGLAAAWSLVRVHCAPGCRRQGQAAPLCERLAPRVLAGLALGGLLAIGAFVALTLDVLAGRGLSAVDPAATAALVAARRPWLTALLVSLTWLGSLAGLALGGLAAGLWFGVRRRDWGALALLGATLVGAVALNGAVKALVGRVRPAAELGATWALGSAFPSGHSSCALATLGLLAALLGSGRRAAARLALGALAGLLALGVGFSRVYLGVHWLSDVVAGWLLGLIWILGLCLCLSTGGRSDRR